MSTTTDKLTKEATERGLDLIGPGRIVQYRLYRYQACGHTEEIHTGAVRKGGFRCSTCLQEKLETEATERGLDLIGQGSDAHYRLYRYHACGHTEEISLGNVRKGTFRCSACLQAKLETEATERGLDLIGPGKNYNYRLYRYHACGHVEEVRPVEVRKGMFRCSTCIQAKLETEAKERGLDLIGTGRNRSYRLYRYHACGHTEETHTGNVRKGAFRCSICSPVSAGEVSLQACFKGSGVHAEQQKTVRISNSNRRFDFEVKLRTKTILVEFDGLQHFGPVQWYGDPEKEFLKLSQADLHKNLYAASTGIPLIRIHYNVHTKRLIPQAVDRISALERDGELDAAPFMILPDPDGDGILVQPLVDFLFEEGRRGMISTPRRTTTLP